MVSSGIQCKKALERKSSRLVNLSLLTDAAREAVHEVIESTEGAEVRVGGVARAIADRPVVVVTPSERRAVEVFVIIGRGEKEGCHTERVLRCIGQAGITRGPVGVVDGLEVISGITVDTVEDNGHHLRVRLLVRRLALPSKERALAQVVGRSKCTTGALARRLRCHLAAAEGTAHDLVDEVVVF